MVQRQGEEKSPPPPPSSSRKFNEAEGLSLGLEDPESAMQICKWPWPSSTVSKLVISICTLQTGAVADLKKKKYKSQEFYPSADGDLDAVVTGHHQHRIW